MYEKYVRNAFMSLVVSIVSFFKKCREPYENSRSKNLTQSRTSLTFFLAMILSFICNRPSSISYWKTYFYASNHYLPQLYWWITYVWTICLLHWNVCFHANGPGFTKVDQIITKWNIFYSSLSGCTKFCTIGMTFMYCFGNVILYLNKTGD
jgi:hypothetical protein